MADYGPSVRPYWPKVDGRRREYLVISEPESWFSHWEPQLRRARRCGGPRCLQCAIGMQKQLRVVLMAVDQSGRDALIELRERHRETLDCYESTVGLRIELKRAGTAANAAVDLKVLGQSAACERNIAALVRSFGLPPLEGPVESSRVEEAASLIGDEPSTQGDQPRFGKHLRNLTTKLVQ